MIRWNWGTGITIFIALFMATCILFLVFSRGIKWSLVEDNYYAKELKHEEKLVKIRNVNDLNGTFSVRVTSEEVTLSFPDDFKSDRPDGTVHVYRPSDDALDFTEPIRLDSLLTMHMAGSKFKHGKYVIKADWTAMGKGYYLEKEMFFP